MANDQNGGHWFEIAGALGGALLAILLAWLTRVSTKVDKLMEWMAVQRDRSERRDKQINQDQKDREDL